MANTMRFIVPAAITLLFAGILAIPVWFGVVEFQRVSAFKQCVHSILVKESEVSAYAIRDAENECSHREYLKNKLDKYGVRTLEK